jgi:ABC-type dipeptide/oligopeptide/nickel transport system permease component
MIVQDSAKPHAQRSRSSTIAIYLARRAASVTGVLFIVTVLVFLLIHLAPGGPENAILGDTATPEQRQEVRIAFGLDRPLIEQYGSYLGSLMHLDFGQSYVRHTSTIGAVSAAASITIPLLIGTWILASVTGILLGTLSAARPGTWIDRLTVGTTTLGASAPSFAVGTLLAGLFGVRLGWFPVGGAGDAGVDRLEHLILPVVTSAIVAVAGTARLARVRVGQILEEDQMVFAVSRGLGNRWLLKNVILRNAGVLLITAAANTFIILITAQLIVEQVFNLPGIGSLLVESLTNQDIPMVQTIVLMIAIVILCVNMIADALRHWVDPRIRPGLRVGR